MKVTITRGLYGSKPWGHFRAYAYDRDWCFLEVGSWTVEMGGPFPKAVHCLVAAGLMLAIPITVRAFSS